jgi:hypothetical protein
VLIRSTAANTLQIQITLIYFSMFSSALETYLPLSTAIQ